MATPTNGAIAIKGIPNIPPSCASKTTDPVAKTTTIKVPITSAKNFLWLDVNRLVSLKTCDKFLHSLLNFIPNFSYFFDRFSFRIFNIPIKQVIQK